MTLRCIATPLPACTRCHRVANARDGLYMCAAHQILPIVANCYNEERTRRMLAFTAWETIDQGQALIDSYVEQTREVA